MPAVGALVRSTNGMWIARPVRPRWIARQSKTSTMPGDTTAIRVPLAVLAVLFDRLGRYEPAAIIAGFAFSPLTAASFPNINKAIAPPA